MLAAMGYPGGKNGAGVYQRIINLMPPHDVYIEPFLGGGAVMRLKRPARLNIGLDLVDSAVSAMEASIASSGGPAGSPYSALSADHVGNGDSAGSLAGNGVVTVSRFQFARLDGIEFLRVYPFTGRELVYCDPPYLRSTRSGRDLYEYEMSDVDHRRLLRVLLEVPCMVMVSGYWSQMYVDELKAWNSIHFEAMTRGGHTATEWLWFNFTPPLILHDDRYLGEGFRAREKLKRKKLRWTERLRRMPLLERQALLSAIASIDK